MEPQGGTDCGQGPRTLWLEGDRCGAPCLPEGNIGDNCSRHGGSIGRWGQGALWQLSVFLKSFKLDFKTLVAGWNSALVVFLVSSPSLRASHVVLGVNNLPTNARDTRDTRDVGLIPGWGRSPGVRNGTSH